MPWRGVKAVKVWAQEFRRSGRRGCVLLLCSGAYVDPRCAKPSIDVRGPWGEEVEEVRGKGGVQCDADVLEKGSGRMGRQGPVANSQKVPRGSIDAKGAARSIEERLGGGRHKKRERDARALLIKQPDGDQGGLASSTCLPSRPTRQCRRRGRWLRGLNNSTALGVGVGGGVRVRAAAGHTEV